MPGTSFYVTFLISPEHRSLRFFLIGTFYAACLLDQFLNNLLLLWFSVLLDLSLIKLLSN